ncbi:SatD family protein [Halorussus caseinilyticus]|uniref:SatD family protein n=1 Tax=Halorussus caseinilyticus TaxID=3034025 RepID=A0ABD5WMS6_9EURY
MKGVDEIGGVLNAVPPVVEIQRRLALALHPQQIRLAAVVGEIDVNAASADVAAMDGPAFARADALLAELEDADLTFELRGTVPVVDDLLSGQINLLDMFRAEWTERQVEVLSKYEELDSQKAVADSLAVSPQAVSNVLANTKGPKVLALERRLAGTVSGYPSLDADEGEA